MPQNSHYVPVLRCKKAECMALRELSAEDRAHVTPLIEIPRTAFVPVRRRSSRKSKPKDPAKVVHALVHGLKQAWGDHPLLLDVGLLKAGFRIGDSLPLEAFAGEARKQSLEIVPVASIRASEPQRGVLRRVASTRGVCLRLKELDLLLPDFLNRLREFHRDIKVHPRRTDLVIDFEECYEGGPSYASICETIPALDQWRSFTIVSGAFAKNLAGYPMNTVSSRRRADWIRWLEQSQNGTNLPRRPNYGDYTIQFARYLEPKPGSRPSASVRYALPNEWLILRGEWPGKENGPGREQYTMWAQVLLGRDDFSGEAFSAGDAYIAARARDESHPGDPMEWLFAGINRHITLTLRQLATLRAV